MAIIPQPVTNLLVRVPGDHPVERLLSLLPAGPMTLSGPRPTLKLMSIVNANAWHVLTPSTIVPTHPWDAAHALARAAATARQPIPYVEPDLQQSFVATEALAGTINAMALGMPSDLDPHWPPATGAGAALDWHLARAFSQLKDARDAVGDVAIPRRVRIAHLDTGYSENHETCPLHLQRDMAWNFVENNASAVDPASYHGVLQNPGHGTATLALLAGNRCSLSGDFLGGAAYAEVVPVRIANSVVHFGTQSIAGGIHHAVGWSCDVISLSMGGLPAQSWADQVNAAYEAGCFICAASGDSIGGLPTHYTIYPARFGRVISACGVTYSGAAYFDQKYNFQGVLEGSFGPDEAMGTALSAYTPNVPWAKVSTVQDYSRSGGGTSAATPQIAAAAALYIQKHLIELSHLPGWQRVEAVRHALFTAAQPADRSYFGNGFLRAADALNMPVNANIPKRPYDNIDFALLKELFGWDLLSAPQQNMLAVEAAQLVTASGKLRDAIKNADLSTTNLTAQEKKDAVDALAASPMISKTLKGFLAAARVKM